MPTDHRLKLAAIKRFDQLVAYLRDELGWPLENGSDFEDLTFDYFPEELGIDAKTAAKIQEIKRLRPLSPHQPWGIFFVKFEPKQLPVIALRRILSQVALKKRASSNSADRAAWAADDLLFVSNYGESEERQISFAHFSTTNSGQDLPILKVLGWDNRDTALHLDAVVRELSQNLAWPEDDSDAEEWRKRWRTAFTLENRAVVSTSKDLSVRLAELARSIRGRIKAAIKIETDSGPLTTLMKAFQTSLVHDLDTDGFADMYAQTIAYGLLSARIADPQKKTADDFAAHMRTNPFLRELMETFLKVGGRRGKAGGPGIDFDELGVSDVVQLLDDANMEAVVRDFGDRNPQEDPVIHFYELFLKEYDAKKRMSRGVFYTPRPVVSYIVKSIHEKLISEFGLEDGLADPITWGEMLLKRPELQLPMLTDDPEETRKISPDEFFVQVLDPSTGTATFLVEVIDVVYRTLTAKWNTLKLTKEDQLYEWNKYVPAYLLPRIYAFEIMMAPYAIAHMKISLKLVETGYKFNSEERARIYLTNSIEPWKKQLILPEIGSLANEAFSVNEIKKFKRFTVVTGNPPYSVSSQNKNDYIDGLMDLYRTAVKVEKNIQPLSDDYIKFICLSQKIIETTGTGLVGLITNNSYLSGLIHRGVREELLKSFNKINIINLHGNTMLHKIGDNGDLDQNIFDIRQGISIILLSKNTKKEINYTLYSEIIGSKQIKLDKLDNTDFSKNIFQELQPASPQYYFIIKDIDLNEEYGNGWKLNDIFPLNNSGVKTHRDAFVYDMNKSKLINRIASFRDTELDDNYFKETYSLKEGSNWNINKARTALRKDLNWQSRFFECLYRPFDIRYIFFSGDLIDRTRQPLMDQMTQPESNIALLAMRQVATGENYTHFGVSKWIIDNRIFFSNRGIVNLFPLYIQNNNSEKKEPKPNISDDFIKTIQKNLKITFLNSGYGDFKTNIGPNDIFNYIFAIFHSKYYRTRYEKNLRDDFPRIPITNNINLFEQLSLIGKRLVSLNIFEYLPIRNNSVANFPVDGANIIDTIKFIKTDDSSNILKIYINNFQYFDGIPDKICDIHVGGYRVCYKWLNDRLGTELTKEDIFSYQNLIRCLYHTNEYSDKIDRLIISNKGW